MFRDVRKSCLWNIPITESTIDCVVERCRDVDATVRRSVYLRICEEGDEVYALLSREALCALFRGCEDRDTNVKKACEKLVVSFIGESEFFDVY